MKTAILLSLSFVFTSCMVGMMGMGGDRHSGDHQGGTGTTIEKELTVGNLTATASFPPLVLGKETTFGLKLREALSGQVISGARVSFHATLLSKVNRNGGNEAHAMHGGMDSIHAPLNTNDVAGSGREIQGDSLSGLFNVAFAPSESGEYALTFRVSAIGIERIEPELVIEARQNVMPGRSSGGGMTHGSGSLSEYAIIGAVIMGAMMVIMWATRGSLF